MVCRSCNVPGLSISLWELYFSSWFELLFNLCTSMWFIHFCFLCVFGFRTHTDGNWPSSTSGTIGGGGIPQLYSRHSIRSLGGCGSNTWERRPGWHPPVPRAGPGQVAAVQRPSPDGGEAGGRPLWPCNLQQSTCSHRQRTLWIVLT